jgi:DNA-binding transcriptional regulator YhcF (GntR family)
MKHIAIEDIKIPKPNFAVSKESKGQLISSWLINLIKHLLECGIADVGDFLPSKDEFAKFLDVSPATMQISIRQVKNLGYLN